MNQEERWLLEEKFGGAESEAFRADLSLLRSGTPLAYLIGSVPFLNCKIRLDSRPLIPRVETEYWVEKAIEEIKKVGEASLRPLRILDLCSGSGCIGVSVAKNIPSTLVDFAEVDSSHLATILKNIKENNIDIKRTNILIGDLFENVTEKYDFILSNPPYIDPEIDRAEESVKTHEPHIALYGGNEGMEIITKIISEAKNYLTELGQLWIEHEPEQSGDIATIATGAGFARATTLPDQYDISRFTIIVR